MTPRWLVVLYRRFGTTIGPIFKGQKSKKKGLGAFLLDFLTFEDGIDRLYRNVGTELPLNAV
jgi:hypothetical protein